MKSYDPDVTHSHQRYQVLGEKESKEDDCCDTFQGVVHSKQDMERLINALRKLGFSVRVSRVTNTVMVDEPFPSDREDEREEK